ncbi:hypothetical protein TRIP_B40259 [uncultured Desulfatiglans sp.]|nr:hypothetical protein TRIP_B40259 [uncultured Desulfatiglans sp.]
MLGEFLLNEVDVLHRDAQIAFRASIQNDNFHCSRLLFPFACASGHPHKTASEAVGFAQWTLEVQVSEKNQTVQ